MSAVLNFIGLRCPLPLLQTQLHVKAMANGEVVWVVGSDVQAGKDIATWCAKKAYDCQPHVHELASAQWGAELDAAAMSEATFILKITKQ